MAGRDDMQAPYRANPDASSRAVGHVDPARVRSGRLWTVRHVARRPRRRRPAPRRRSPWTSTTTAGSPSRCPATGAARPPSPTATARSSTAPASSSRPARRGRPPLGRARRHLLPGRRVARRRLPRRPGGLLLPPRLRDHRPGPPRRRARAGRRGHLRAARRQDGEAQHHRRVPALGLHRPDVEPGRAVAPGPRRAHRAGAHRPPAGALHARPTPSGAQSAAAAPSSTATTARTVRVRTTVDDRVERERELRLAQGSNEVEWSFGIDNPSCGGRGRSATSR